MTVALLNRSSELAWQAGASRAVRFAMTHDWGNLSTDAWRSRVPASVPGPLMGCTWRLAFSPHWVKDLPSGT